MPPELRVSCGIGIGIGIGDRTVPVRAEVTSGTEVAALVDTARERFGGLHIMVNNAGIDGEFGPIVGCTEETLDRVVAVNLRGVFLGMKHAIPLILSNGGGSVINVASAAGLIGFPMISAYCASKGGVVQLTKTAALADLAVYLASTESSSITGAALSIDGGLTTH